MGMPGSITPCSGISCKEGRVVLSGGLSAACRKPGLDAEVQGVTKWSGLLCCCVCSSCKKEEALPPLPLSRAKAICGRQAPSQLCAWMGAQELLFTSCSHALCLKHAVPRC